MRAILFSGTILLHLITSTLGAESDPLVQANEHLWAGRYAEAVEGFKPLIEKQTDAVWGLARAYEEQGEYDKAVNVLQAGRPSAVFSAELARLAFERGKYDDAQSHVEKAMKLDENQPLALWIQAELHRVHGREDEAEAFCRQLIRYYNENEIDRPESLRWIGRAAAQFARMNRQSDQFDFIVNELYPDAIKLQADYWPAHYETGLLFLEKYNFADAAKEFRTALNRNPQAAEVHAALARVWLAQRDYTKTETEIDRALELNPHLLDAWLTKSDLKWANLQVAETLETLEKKVLPLQPQCEETLARLAACYRIIDGEPADRAQVEASRFVAICRKVVARNPKPGVFYFVLAEKFDAQNKRPLAEKYYRESIRVMPKRSDPFVQLGLLYMQSGRETEARPLLKKAFKGDPFNVRVHNMLNLLDVLDKMQTRETDHCLIRYEKVDSLLGRYAEKQVEVIFEDLSRRFGYTPPRKTPIDIFNQAEGQSGHAWFSTRVSGLPFIGTIAASTGNLVAMVSPNMKNVSKRFNWVLVLRHEITHVITLQQTDFNIPHWYTEGLAVWSEDHPRPAEWNRLLLRRVPKGNLFTLDTIDSGFTRPQSSSDWIMAYCQAKLYVDYMMQLKGEKVLKQLLDAYAAGNNTEAALKQVFGMSQAEFEKGFRVFIRKETENLKGLPWPDLTDLASLKKAAESHPKDGKVLAELAAAYLQRGVKTDAVKTVEKAMEITPVDPLAVAVRAQLLSQSGKKEDLAQAVTMLEKALDRTSPQPNVLKNLAEMKLKGEKYEEAERLFSLGEKLDPSNLDWTRSLVQVFEATKNTKRLVGCLERITEGDIDDLEVRKKLSRAALERKDYPTAEKWARQALDIDLRDVEVHSALAESLAGRHNELEAIEEWKIAVELKPDAPEHLLALANAYVRNGQKDQARSTLKKLRQMAPHHPGADVLLESLGE